MYEWLVNNRRVTFAVRYFQRDGIVVDNKVSLCMC